MASLNSTSNGHDIVVKPIGELSDTYRSTANKTGPWTIRNRPPKIGHRTTPTTLTAKEKLPADLFLTIDPLVSLSTAIASRSWVWSLVCAGIILLDLRLYPARILWIHLPAGDVDRFVRLVGQPSDETLSHRGDGWWVHLKYYILLGTLICAASGVLVSGYVAAIPGPHTWNACLSSNRFKLA